MEYKELGATGVRLPVIGLGTWQYKGGVGPLREGIALGACLIDTAESYGTEEIVGKSLRGIRDQVFVATKISPRHFKHSDVISAADRSLQRLQIDHIDLYQLHWPNCAVPIDETMGAMEDLVDRGKVRFIGVSNFSLVELKQARAVLRKHSIVSNQVRYSLIDRSIEVRLLTYCRQNNITVIAYSPLARGIQNIKGRDPHGILSKVAAMTGKTQSQVALNWCISKSPVIAIPKSNSIGHVVENCKASNWRLSAGELRLLDEGIRFKRRGRAEAALRRAARCVGQKLGYIQ
ncbi:MAG TPA: aldo/keto reductase [Acidobacteriota bacterium]|jgi:diketogulonate reductase-like aldo/keto reductase